MRLEDVSNTIRALEDKIQALKEVKFFTNVPAWKTLHITDVNLDAGDTLADGMRLRTAIVERVNKLLPQWKLEIINELESDIERLGISIGVYDALDKVKEGE